MIQQTLFALLLVSCLAFASTKKVKGNSPLLDLKSRNGSLWLNNERFYLKGLSWFGFETSIRVFHGLWDIDYHFFLDFIQANDFNAMRVPFYLDLVLDDPMPNGIGNYNHSGDLINQDIQNLTSMQVMDTIINEAGKRGILIMLDLHSFEADAYASNGLWYDGSHPESLVLQGWSKLIKRYANTWNVVAFDLKNEPFQGTWNTGNLKTDWDAAVARISNYIHSNGGERFLVFAEGVASSPPCAQNCFYGGNLIGVNTAPIKINLQDKLVYSPHTYGPDVAYQPYWKDPTFPENMPAIWQNHFGFIPKKTGQALVVGEWGGHLDGADGQWINRFIKWLQDNDVTDNFFWCMNPDSSDTGGLLEDDWMTPITAKLELLAKLNPHPTKVVA